MFLFAKDKKTTSLYVLYIISLIMNVAPNTIISTFGSLLFLVVFIATYILKYRSEEGSIPYSHYCFLIKTVWIFTFFTSVGILIAYYFGDHAIINNLVSSVSNGNMISIEQINSSIIAYGLTNKYVFGLIFFPVTIHLFYRLGKGLCLARNNAPISNLKSWL